MSKVKEMPKATNGKLTKHKIPTALTEKLSEFREEADRKIKAINQEFQTKAELMVFGFREGQGLPDTNYDLTPDWKFLIEK